MSENDPQSTSNDAGSAQGPISPTDVLRAVREAFFRANHGQVASRLWDRVLTDEQREELGGDFNAAYQAGRGAVGMWMLLYHVSQARAAIEVARRMDLLSETDYQWLDREISKVDPTPPTAHALAKARDAEAAVRRARTSHLLVLVNGNGYHRLYWRGEWIKKSWSKSLKIWEFLCGLIEKGALGQSVGWDLLSDKDEDAVVDRRSRLKKLIPETLDDLIHAEGGGRYRLQLAANDIFVLQLVGDDWLMYPDDTPDAG